ncbi:MAG: AzlD domain-containing protein [Microthrixaceae bacterium]|nr:AzlD domain-containing protein [Microthrixaceae bacterium]
MSFTVEVLLAALGTYLMRVSVIALAAGRELPERLRNTLRLIPAAVLPALVANALVFDGGSVRPLGPWYVAFALALLVSIRTRSIGWTLGAGMVAVWVATAVWP